MAAHTAPVSPACSHWFTIVPHPHPPLPPAHATPVPRRPPPLPAAVIEYCEPSDARAAFRSLAYKPFQHVPLYLEWAPAGIFTEEAPRRTREEAAAATAAAEAAAGAAAAASAGAGAAAQQQPGKKGKEAAAKGGPVGGGMVVVHRHSVVCCAVRCCAAAEGSVMRFASPVTCTLTAVRGVLKHFTAPQDAVCRAPLLCGFMPRHAALRRSR